MYAQTATENVFTTCMMLIGVSVFATIIASAGSALKDMDVRASARKQQMDSIRHFMRFRKVPQQLQNIDISCIRKCDAGAGACGGGFSEEDGGVAVDDEDFLWCRHMSRSKVVLSTT